MSLPWLFRCYIACIFGGGPEADSAGSDISYIRKLGGHTDDHYL